MEAVARQLKEHEHPVVNLVICQVVEGSNTLVEERGAVCVRRVDVQDNARR